ncbi:mannose-1-phosphate guanylyltransferase/mannose-6-phosphate isomerase [Desulfobulbus rhabdoformis]|uniref:mannose-1-phosphate guanylyltransferase/mannose-6-phosphate isomerase n=1 Tax=Desulfobulbus rhabdoformis TaxID=34032 RepID=UPI003B834099
MQPVILAGGTGSRLWPLSRELYPKQVINLTGDLSLLQNTVLRLSHLNDVLDPIIVVGEEHRFLTKTQLEDLNAFSQFQILLEPCGKNTAPAICGAAAFVAKKGRGQDILLVLPADHLIQKEAPFTQAVQQAAVLAEEGKIVTFGIVPDHPETGYGYIARGEGTQVESFVEKPDLATAEQYLASGRYFWNSGMFAFTAETMLAEMEIHAPVILEQMTNAVQQGAPDGVFFRFNAQNMGACPSDSIDYVVMEKTDKACVVEADIGWSDIGSWKALWEVAEKDDQGNVSFGDVVLEDVKNSLVRAEHTLVATVGLEDTLVVETADAVLVAPMNRSQDVKKIVSRLKQEKRPEYHTHRTVYRPWGSYTTLELQPRFQIKRITVHPGARLSLQMHHHRHEHWVVVSGTAKIQNGEQSILLKENESTYIPSCTVHRLENPGVIPLELIEVQIGSYLGEDDIVRFDDEYGRVQQ